MKKYKIGLYEKAIRDTFTWSEKLKCAKRCGYDFLEISIDASEEKIQRIYLSKEEKKEIVDAIYEADIPIGSMSVSALTKYALGDGNEEIRNRGVEIMEKSIVLAADLGIRTVMLPGYDIYFGESTVQTKKYFMENIRNAAEIAAREGVLLGFETMENSFMNTTAKGMKYTSCIESPFLKIYPDSGNITNAAYDNKHDVCDDLMFGKGELIALHLKESLPGVYREVPFLTGHVDFENVIAKAWELGVRRYVTELWDVGETSWEEAIVDARTAMCNILDKQV